ncbi:MAG: hypothetical protein OEZ42_08975 [Gemmatimonadota bacterium]|nr:hypothetical protein [Gemmatimonadota bacterium]MDH5550024.1 hypothetical protein [Gemmatimonadota bacterium]
MLTRLGFAVAGAALAACLVGCGNVGEDRVLSIMATGSIEGVVYFDQNGSGQLDGSEVGLADIGIRVIALGTRDTVARPVTASDGSFATAQLPVGRYRVSFAPGAIGDSVVVTQFEDSVALLAPGGMALVTVGVGFPSLTIAGARAQVPGKRFFVEGVALTALDVFGDTTTHVADGTGAIRAVRVRRTVVQQAGDSVRLQGTVASRAGQPVLDDVTVIVLDINRLIPPAELVSTGVAASADGGRLDAALAQVRNVAIADTATGATGFALTLDDGSGALTVLLDADIVFDLTGLDPGASIDATGVLVPDGGGTWRLKPRGNGDLVRR